MDAGLRFRLLDAMADKVSVRAHNATDLVGNDPARERGER